MNFNVCVVIVTYNRVNKLKVALKHYENQVLLPSNVIVVNNASTDSTSNFLSMWSSEKSTYKKHVITLDKNLGGAGGYYEGQKFASQLPNIDWIMIADDDAYPLDNYLLGLKKSYISFPSAENIAVLCGRVEENQNCVNMHRSFWNSKWNWSFRKVVPMKYYSKAFFEPDFVSYVGILIRKRVLDHVGLVNKDLFIWDDDTEHSYRIKKVGKILCFPSYCIIHDVDKVNLSLSWKSYYGIRNKVFFFKKYLPFQSLIVIPLIILKALLCQLKGYSITESKLRLSAIFHGLMGNLGEHKIYKPGWNPNK